MELIPQELKKKIPKLYETEDTKDPIVYVKLFIDGWTWYITELSIDDNLAFGYVVSPFCSGKIVYFSINELKGSLGIGVERDLSFNPIVLSTLKYNIKMKLFLNGLKKFFNSNFKYNRDFI